MGTINDRAICARVKGLGIPASCLGIGFVSVLTELSYINPPYVRYHDPGMLFGLFDASTVLLAIVIAASIYFSKLPRTLVSKDINLVLACGMLVLSACINFGSQMLGLDSFGVYAVAAILGGLGIALLFVMWFEVVSHLNPVKLVMCYAIAAIGRVVLIWFCSGMTLERVWAFLCVTVVVSAALLAFARDGVSVDAPAICGRMKRGSGVGEDSRERLCRFPMKPLLVVLTGTLLLSFVLRSIGNAWGTNGNPGIILAGAGVLGVLLVKGDAFDFKRLWQASLVFMVLAVALFVMLGGSDVPMVAGMLACVAYELCLMLMYAILGNLVYRNFYNPTFLFAVELAVALIAGHAGTGLARFLVVGLPTGLTVVVFVGAVCVLGVLFSASCAWAFSKKGLQDEWGAIVRTPLSQDFDLLFEKTRLGLRCHELAQQTNLSRREEEILLLLVQKKKPAAIAEQLGIEVSTVATHRKHVYQKLGVHSAKQLQERIGSATSEESAA